MADTQCATPELLSRYVGGQLDAEKMAIVESHLLKCDSCATQADTLNPNDDVTVGFVSASSSEMIDDAELQAVMERAVASLGFSEFDTPKQSQTVDASQEDTGVFKTRQAQEDATRFLGPAELPGELGRLGGYRILEVLGMGGMGIVFRAEDPRLKRAVAIKVMKPSAAANDRAKERFLREAQAAAAIDHDNVVTVLQVGEDEGVPFIAMPLLKGESLQERLEHENKLPELEAIEIGRQIAEGLAAAHQRGLVHRDIKPDNVWIEADRNRMKVLDFGLARLSEDDIGLTQSGAVLGTPRYMAPEQACGEQVDHRSDLFSLGSVLYHLVSGRAPFDGKTLSATLLKVSQADTTPIARLSPELSPDLHALINGLLSKDPDQRPQTAADVAKKLATIKESLRSPTESTPNPQQASKKWRWTAALGLGLLLVLGTFAVTRFSNRYSESFRQKQVATNRGDTVSGSDQSSDNPTATDPPATDPPAQAANEMPPDERPSIDSKVKRNVDQQASVKSQSPELKIASWKDRPGFELEIRHGNGDHGMLQKTTPIPEEPFYVDGIFFDTREGRPVNDQDIDYLLTAGLPQLRTVGWKGQAAKAEWIAELANRSPELQALFFEQTASLELLDALELLPGNLQNLILGGELTDEGLERIAKIDSLNALHFDMPEEEWLVSDNGVDQIAKLSDLKLLYFYHTMPSGLGRLQEQLPDCEINYRDSDGALKIWPRDENQKP